MTRYEYKVVPAPTSGLKAKGVKSSEARFAHALETLMNELGAEGWTYVRADTLPCEERSGLTGRVTKYQNMLVFQRALASEDAPEVAGLLSAPAPEPPETPSTEPLPELEDDDHQPSPTAPALGPAEPRLTRYDAPDTSAAARAAAAALRPFRSQSQAQPKAPAAQEPERNGRGSGVAAE